MRSQLLAKIWILVLLCSHPGLQSAHAAENTFNLDAKIAATVPTSDEDRWLIIPWRTNLMKARLEAQNLNRPMFLWIMNGNPMGCT
ncbi:MAG: hypothetical protein JST89_06170 [Cyanobacteria bacterium SZAS-4]|nr:hypothetical protein [Cyanobacteria bacterium SZAS-4]